LLLTAELERESETLDIPIYKGKVQFISFKEWKEELLFSVEQCSTHESKRIFIRTPDEEQKPDAAAAWCKINQVYGHGTLEQYHGQPQESLYQALIENYPHIAELLSPTEPGQTYRTITVQEGRLTSIEQVEEMAAEWVQRDETLRWLQRQWAEAFQIQINEYVHFNGNGEQLQMWLLVRKVVLEGPWNVLITGACLVDLPGVSDANAARAVVAKSYLRNCDAIWIVAPIQRAVDDGIAKKLLGHSFRQRLLMDGAYGNVSFVCTQTDECKAKVIIRDHANVAKETGLWHNVTSLQQQATDLEKKLTDLRQKKKDSRIKLEEGAKIDSWKPTNRFQTDELKAKFGTVQRKLKQLCAHVRNQYTMVTLQNHFHAGLLELTRKDNAEMVEGEEDEEVAKVNMGDFCLKVFCTSANDYLRCAKINPFTDEPPHTFSRLKDTQIPALREFVHETTAQHQIAFFKDYVRRMNDIMDQVKLVAMDTSDSFGCCMSSSCKAAFDTEMTLIPTQLHPIVNAFQTMLEDRVRLILQPSLEKGAKAAEANAVAIAKSWRSTKRRTRYKHSLEQNGLVCYVVKILPYAFLLIYC